MQTALSPRSARAGRFFVLIAILVGAFGLRLWHIEQPSIWHDEGWSIRAIRDPIGTPDDNTPPLYYGLLHGLWLGAGETPLALRYGSVLLDVITVALALRLARQWAGWDASVLAGTLLALSPLLWAYAREVRAYVAVPLLALVLLALTDRLLAPRAAYPWRVWGALLVAELALLYTHNLSVPVVAWLNLVVGATWVWQRRWRWLAIWVGGQAGLLLAYVPWLAGQSRSGTPLNSPPRITLGLAWKIWQGYFAPLPTMIGAERPVEIGSALIGIGALAAAGALVLRRRNRHTLLVLSQAVVLPVLAMIELHAAHIDFHPRYTIAGVPAALLVIALGLDALPRTLPLRHLAFAAGMALAVAVGVPSLSALLDEPQYQHDDFQAIAQYYATLPADALIVIPYGWEPALEVYYEKKLDIQAEIVGIPLHGGPDAVIERVNAALAQRDGPVRVELLTWYQLPADLRGMYPCLLEAAGRRSAAEPLTVQGLTTTGYLVERPLALTPVEDALADYGALVLDGAALGGQQNVCVRTDWTRTGATASDWRVSGRIVTVEPPGWIIARSDSDIRRDDQLPTSRWKTGQDGAAFSLLHFPDGAPPTAYTVQIIAFSAKQPGGIDRLVNGVPSGTSLALTRVSAVGTTDQVPSGASERVPLTPDGTIALVGHDAQGCLLAAGQPLRITLQWAVTGDCCRTQPWTAASLVLRGDGWQTAQPVSVYGAYSLDWYVLVVPAEASGSAVLELAADGVDPVPLASYTVEQTDRLFALPAFAVEVGTEFSGLAVLEGATVAETTVSPGAALDLTLVWRALATPTTSYRVFTHLLSEEGRVIAQDDDYPQDGARLTTGWVPGEYLEDRYHLVFNDEGRAYRGPARLEVGFYDPDTGARVLVANGADHVVLPIAITVQ